MTEPSPLRLAIVGADALTLALARLVLDRTDVEIICVTDQGSAIEPHLSELQRAVARSAKARDDWEALLDPGYVDGVLIARGNDTERRSDQLRKFAQVAVPVLCSHPVVDDALLMYELDMIRQDTSAVIVPALTDRQHPVIQTLVANLVAGASNLGTVQQCNFERPLTNRDKPSVLHQFAVDVDLLRQFCGELNQVSAMAAANDDAAYGNLMVQLNGPQQRIGRWSVLPVDPGTRPAARLTIVGSQRQAVVEMPSDDRLWSVSGLELAGIGQPLDWNRHASLLQRFVGQVRRKPPEADAADLLDAARALELTETIGRSLRRRRTIDLHFEEHSEENTFRSTMAAGGCLLLMLGLVALPILGIAAKAGIPGVGLWPWLMAGAFGLFVLLQLLTLTFRK